MKRKLLATALILITVYALLFIWLQQKERVSFESHFLNIMKRLNTIENRTRVRSWFERPYNFTELCEWVHANIEFVPFNETFERHTDPAEILDSGKGRCEEFSILYVSACLAHEHQGRLVATTDASNPLNLYVPHVWTEVELSGYWVHVDPSEQRWNETNMYQSWKWGKDIGSKIRIYAFDYERCQDVTSRYECTQEECKTTVSHILMELAHMKDGK